MPGRVSCRLYLLLDALESFDISLDLRSREVSNYPTHLLDALESFDISLDLQSREVSNFPTHLEVNTTDRKHTLS